MAVPTPGSRGHTPDLLHDRVAAAIGDLYDLGAELGRGAMSVVYQATDLRLKRAVAVKVLPPDLAFRVEVRSRFLREAETAAQLGHPHIVPIYTVDERHGIVYFVMPLLEGETLEQRLARDPRPPFDEVRRVLREVADALAFAHERGVIHRDVKPENIFLDRRSGRSVVADFGIARAAEGDLALTMTGTAIGTPAYMSPEQATGERELDGRSDVYALGVVGYLMVAGRLPFEASSTPAMMMKHIAERPRPLRELRADAPPALAAAIERALAKRREDRWSAASHFRDAMADPALHASPSRAGPDPGRWEPPQRVVAPAAPPAAYPAMSRREVSRRPLEERMRIFRRNIAGSGGLVLVLAGINYATTPWLPWFLFPALGIGARVMRQWGSLWSDGLSWRQVFGREPVPVLAGRSAAAAAQRSADEVAAKLASPHVLQGAHGAAVRRAIANRVTILGTIESLTSEDRALIPDVVPTVNALVERTAMLAQMLHRLDTDVSPAMIARLEARIGDVEREPLEAADRDRRLALLQRQRASVRDLADRRAKVASRLESAALALENLKLDLLKLRASGVAASIQDLTQATQEARALSREIGHVLEAAAEIKGM